MCPLSVSVGEVCVCVYVCLLGLIQLHVTYQVRLRRDFSVFLIEMSLSDCGVCSCFLVLATY